MEVNIYDFDKTVIPFDSGSLFLGYCLLHYPWTIITAPVLAVGGVLLALRIINMTKFKKFCFCAVALVPLQKAVKGFWDRHEKDIHPWFYETKKQRPAVVISASPDFLLKEIAKRANFDYLICTHHNEKTGAIIGENCRGNEKVRLFEEKFENVKVIDVFSDSIRHDGPIFALATRDCYHVIKGKPVKFNYNKNAQ